MEDKRKEVEKSSKNKKIHPFENAGFFSMLFYFWMLPLFYTGVKKGITEEVLPPPLKAHNSKNFGDKLEESWRYELNHKKSPSLWRAIWRVFWKDFFYTGIIWICVETFIKGSQPLCMSQLLDYYRPGSTMTLNEAYTYAGLIILISFLQAVASHYYLFKILQLGLKIRVATCSLVYRKALKLSKSSLAETTVGQMVNLISNDVSRFDTATVQFHCLWYCPIQAVVIMILCYIYLGPTAMAGVLLLILIIPFQMWMAKKVSVFRHRTAVRTDQRIRLMNEIISGIMVIKMYTWEKPFAALVELSRRTELHQIRNISYIRAIIGSLNLFLNRCAIYLCLLTFVLIGNVPTAQYVYTLTTFYNLLQYALTVLFPQAITQFAEVSISVKRLHTFLMYSEVHTEKHFSNGELTMSEVNQDIRKKYDKSHKVGINMNRASVKWVKAQSQNTLNDINFTVDGNTHVAIVGPVGSGKTTLFHVILKELDLGEGSMIVNGTISYASQEPWLFAANIRQNIIFGKEFNQQKYEEVVRVCALRRDFSLFPFGDKTIVGERGVTLSGGQKARINLARAVYADADIYLLDDPLSAVDTHVGRHIFDECITGYLRNKCVILITHQLQYLHNVEKIYLLQSGCIRASGTYEELQKSGQQFTELLNEHKEEQEDDDEDTEKQKQKRESRISECQEQPVVEKENTGVGKISWQVYKSYFVAGGHWCKIIALLVGFILSQTCASLTDYFQSFWVNLEQERASQENEIVNSSLSLTNDTFVATETSFWDTYLTENNCLIVYSVLIGLTVTVTVTRSLFFFRFSIKASLRMHNNMFTKIVRATMKFFNRNPSGRILNRFSKDMGCIDEQLPNILLDTIQIAFIVIAVSIVIGSLNPWIFFPTVIIFVIFYLLRMVYLRTSREVKRLEGTARSPIYSLLNASIQGLTTIRAFGAQEILMQEFDNCQNVHSGTWFISVCAARTFGLWLDMHCVAYIALVTLSFLFLQTEIFGGNVGLAITQALSLTGMFQWGMRQWSELENQMTCVERVKEYADVEPEQDKGAIASPKNWPQMGNIRFENLCLSYDPDEPYILKNLSFDVKSTEKVGIVGRTGAGKSSMIAALFRLAFTDGKILIDNVDTKLVSLKTLRSSISIIPQEPVLFSGTLRKNLDPFDEYSDEILWSALEDVELKGVVSDMPQGLESRIVEGGSNFSVGQRQLICLARAIVRNNKILVLDEATANVDPQTDALIQVTIREKFANCTVLTIAHRLHTVMDSDKIIVMDAGRVVEFGSPHTLLQKLDGKLYELVKQTGTSMMKNLLSIAKQNSSGE